MSNRYKTFFRSQKSWKWLNSLHGIILKGD
jgi:hypothetical protein